MLSRIVSTHDITQRRYLLTTCLDFIACIWISYLQCELHVTNLLYRINRRLSKDPETYVRSREGNKMCDEVRGYIEDVNAMIPFLLAGRSILGNRPDGAVWNQYHPPMLFGGLNLQWVLFTVSILNLTPTPMRQSAKTALSWIGRNLGIGMASVLASVSRRMLW